MGEMRTKMTTSDNKKPGFWEGLFAGMEEKPKGESEELKLTKEYIENIELSSEDRVELAGWLAGSVIKSSIASAFEDQPPTQ